MAKKKSLKITACIIAILLIHAIVLLVGEFAGTPLTWGIAWTKGNYIIHTEHKEKDYKIEKIGREFLHGNYVVYISSPTCKDEYFTIRMNKWGNIYLNTYEERVLEMGNTRDRLNKEYTAYVDETGLWEELNAQFSFRETPTGVEQHSTDLYGVIDKLVLNKEYTEDEIKEIGKVNGRLLLPLKMENPNYEDMAEILLEIKRIADEKNVFFSTVAVYVYDAALSVTADPVISVSSFGYKDIYEGNLAERLKEHTNAIA